LEFKIKLQQLNRFAIRDNQLDIIDTFEGKRLQQTTINSMNVQTENRLLA